jgi:ATP-dependent Clp protease protease subunit
VRLNTRWLGRGQAAEIYNEARELLRLREHLCGVMGQAMGKSVDQIKHDFNRDRYFSPDEAVKYGVIDKIIYPKRSAMLGL